MSGIPRFNRGIVAIWHLVLVAEKYALIFNLQVTYLIFEGVLAVDKLCSKIKRRRDAKRCDYGH